MVRYLFVTCAIAWALSVGSLPVAAADPAQTVGQAEEVLAELMSIPARQIPHHLLAEAQGVAIIPNVTKIGFIAGVRRGHGVVMVRDAEGEWSLPQFVTLTGGSVGWQAGIQGADVVLVFRTRKGVEGLTRGKFTIGADASVSAGPVGRNAQAATDIELKAEILSYSRSRGLFLGVAVDGSALDIDHQAHAMYYGSPSAELPRQLPESAIHLRQFLVELTQGEPAAPAATEAIPIQPKATEQDLEGLRRSLVDKASQLRAILNPTWQKYLALPRETNDPAAKPDLDALTELQQRFERIDKAPEYKNLRERAEFQSTRKLLREYIDALSVSGPTLHLPAPPAK
ncbi:MAG: lipid-binding SYLF domain-containing protein [Planctomycetaceae bacterium]